jgi:hypothetical protein
MFSGKLNEIPLDDDWVNIEIESIHEYVTQAQQNDAVNALNQ